MSDHKRREAIAFYTSPRSHFPSARSRPRERVPLRLLRIASRFSARDCMPVHLLIVARLHTLKRAPRPPALADIDRSTVQYRFFRNAGRTQGEPAEKRLTVNRDALPSDNIIQFREHGTAAIRGTGP